MTKNSLKNGSEIKIEKNHKYNFYKTTQEWHMPIFSQTNKKFKDPCLFSLKFQNANFAEKATFQTKAQKLEKIFNLAPF